MSLRVLLADESSTIKKVIELALQDFAVEVKSVNVGTDVVPIATSYQPDIIFVDVLLPKKNGYEICKEIKSDASLSSIPMVLLWSGFMDVDEGKLAGCMPQARLEKPFEADQLRSVVKELVPKSQTQEIGDFLDFPDLPVDSDLSSDPKLPPDPPADLDETFAGELTSAPSSDELELIDLDDVSLDKDWGDKKEPPPAPSSELPDGFGEEFSKVNLQDFSPEGLSSEASSGDDFSSEDLMEIDLSAETNIQTTPLAGDTLDTPTAEPVDDLLPPVPSDSVIELDADVHMDPPAPPQLENLTEDLVSNRDDAVSIEESVSEDTAAIDKYRLDVDDLSDEPSLAIEEISIDDDIDDDDFILSDGPPGATPAASAEDLTADLASPAVSAASLEDSVNKHLTASLDYSTIENLVRKEAERIVEEAVWKIVPEIAERLIKKELDRLMKDVESDYEGSP